MLLTVLLIATRAPMFIRHDVPDSAYLDRGRAAEFVCVGRVDKQGSRCGTCVLIAKQWAITDAHVVDTLKPEDISARFGEQAVHVDKFVISPDYNSEKHKSEDTALGRKGLDIALIHFSSSIADIAPANILPRALKVGEQITAVGFGTIGQGNAMNPITEADPSKRAGTNIVDAIGGDYDGKIPTWLYVTDFDGVGAEAKNRCGDPTPTALECLGTGGDSGGGAFVLEDGTWQLAALFSTTRYFDTDSANATAYGDISMYTRLDEVRAWILSVSNNKNGGNV